jgi:hypothetical protein
MIGQRVKASDKNVGHVLEVDRKSIVDQVRSIDSSAIKQVTLIMQSITQMWLRPPAAPSFHLMTRPCPNVAPPQLCTARVSCESLPHDAPPEEVSYDINNNVSFLFLLHLVQLPVNIDSVFRTQENAEQKQ